MLTYLGDFANVLNIIAIIFSVFSIFFYFRSENNSKNINLARIFFHIVSLSVIFMSFILLILIVKHQYQFTYIYHNSSNDLSFGLLLSSFYAGQEGSFLFWTLVVVIIGIFLIKYSEKHDSESFVMGSFILVLTFLLLLIFNKSPFEKVWQTFPEAIQTGTVAQNTNIISIDANSWFPIPNDGNGLNPLLQNFWMQIHPPILFIGFALMTVPFAFAISALFKREYQKWVALSFPWILFASSILGAGIILGGFWAYETLGWGGYWGWDPVENSSLIPWIISVALVHTAYTQKKTGGLVKSNLVLAIISLVLVIYSTFLTRSGVLENASVHSFTKPGTIVYLLLLLFLLGFLIFGIGMVLFRLKDLKQNKSEYKLLSRESALSIGSITLILSAIIIFFGTSWPIFAKSNVDTSFYNNWNLPLAIVILFLNGFSLIVKWKENNITEIVKKSYLSLILSIIFTIITYFIGCKNFIFLFFVWNAFFALFINIEKLVKVITGAPLKMGAFVSHIGVSLLFLGIVGSAKYSETTNLQLPKNKAVSAFGYNFTYVGQEPFDNGKKTYFNVKIEKDGSSEILKPIMFFNQMSNGVMRIPDIKVTFLKDIYFSPNSLEESKENEKGTTFEFKKDDKIDLGGFNLTFVSSQMGPHSMDKMKMGEEFEANAIFLIEYNDDTKDSLKLITKYTKQGPVSFPALTKDKKMEFTLVKILNKEGILTSMIAIKNVEGDGNIPTGEFLTAEVSIKPFIILFWLGSIIMTLGFFVSIYRRWKEL